MIWQNFIFIFFVFFENFRKFSKILKILPEKSIFLRKFSIFKNRIFLRIKNFQERNFKIFDIKFFKIIFSKKKKFDSDFFSVLEFVPTLDSRHSYSQSTAHGSSTQRFIQKFTVMNFLLEMLSYLLS